MVETGEPTFTAPVDQAQDVTYSRYPWIVREIKGWNIGFKIKIILAVGLLLGALYLMWQWFGWYFILAVITAPAWYFWALRQIDRSSYLVIECRIKGVEFQQGMVSDDTQTNIYQIPPDIWKEITKIGTPWTPGGRIYICDQYRENPETGEITLYFPDEPSLANMSFYTRIKVWIDLKKRLPKLMQDVAVYRYNIEVLAQERALVILDKMMGMEDFIDHHQTVPESMPRRKKPLTVIRKPEAVDHGE